MRQNEKDIFYGIEYNPYRGGNNPRFDRNSRRILDLKNGMAEGIIFTKGILIDFISQHRSCDIIVSVPSSKESYREGNKNSLSRIIRNIHERLLLEDGSQFLRRIKVIPKAATGGPRNMICHLDTIVLCGDVKDKTVLLVDDVCTSGASLLSCKKILIDAGAKDVIMFAIAQTV